MAFGMAANAYVYEYGNVNPDPNAAQREVECDARHTAAAEGSLPYGTRSLPAKRMLC